MARARSKSVTDNKYFLAANLLDHHYKGKNLTTAHTKTAIECIKDLNPDTATALTLYLARVDP